MRRLYRTIRVSLPIALALVLGVPQMVVLAVGGAVGAVSSSFGAAADLYRMFGPLGVAPLAVLAVLAALIGWYAGALLSLVFGVTER